MKNSFAHLIKKIRHEVAPLYPNPDEQEQIALLLLQKVTGYARARILAWPDHEVSPEQETVLFSLVQEHCHNHKPLAYILGRVPFGDLTILVEPPLLIPRPETEEWVMHLCEQLKEVTEQKLIILDMCTGSGAIALALAHTLPQATIYALDIQHQALALAKKNAHHNQINNIIFIQSDLFENLSPSLKFDLIVSNPPYISEHEYEHLDASVKAWEDRTALVAPEQGLAIARALISHARGWLRFNDELFKTGIGNVYCEIGYNQGTVIKEIFQECGYSNVHCVPDLAGHDRVVYGFYTN